MPKFKSKNYTSSDIIMAVLLFVVIAILPLVTKLSSVPLRADEINTIRTGTGYNDVFSHSKSILLMCMGAAAAIFLVFDFLNNDGLKIDFRSFPVINIGIFALLSILSALFSEHISVALMGATERYEGLFVWLCYIVFFTAAFAFASQKRRAGLIMAFYVVSGILLGIIGLLQFLNIPVFETEFVSRLVMGKEYSGVNLGIKFDTVFATLYNPNCAGMCFGMLSSLFIGLGLFLPVKSKLKYASTAAAVLCIISTVGSGSVGGFLGLVCGVGFICIIAVCYFIFVKKSKIAVIASVAAIAVVIESGIIFINSSSTTAQKIKIIYNAVANGETLSSSDNFYKDISIEDNVGKIITAKGIYSVKADMENTELLLDDTPLASNNSIDSSSFSDAAKGSIHKQYKDEDITWDVYLYYSSEEFQNNPGLYNISVISTDALGNDKYFMFGQDTDGKLYFLDKFGTPVDLNYEVPRFGFEGIERLGSNRGYIWSRSIPLLLNNIIIGSGPDTFEFEFPQYDVRSKLVYLNDSYVILDKPHNMYLQYGINTGVLSLIVLIVLFIGYIIQTIKAIFSDNDWFKIALRLGIAAAVTAYLAAGLTTDSVVSVAPLFWTLLGAGFGVNIMDKAVVTKEERQLKKMKKKLK